MLYRSRSYVGWESRRSGKFMFINYFDVLLKDRTIAVLWKEEWTGCGSKFSADDVKFQLYKAHISTKRN